MYQTNTTAFARTLPKFSVSEKENILDVNIESWYWYAYWLHAVAWISYPPQTSIYSLLSVCSFGWPKLIWQVIKPNERKTFHHNWRVHFFTPGNGTHHKNHGQCRVADAQNVSGTVIFCSLVKTRTHFFFSLKCVICPTLRLKHSECLANMPSVRWRDVLSCAIITVVR